MSLNVIQNPNGVKIYNVNIGKAIPKFLTDKQKRKLRKDQEYQRRLDLIQDFEFPTACQKLNYSTDEQYIVACGVYSPQIRIFDLPQLCMKVERHIEVEVVNFKILSNDYSKLAILRMDRTIDFHAQFGFYHRIKIPKSGRDLLYHPLSCDLYVTASGSDVYRVNLEQGQFLSPLNTNFIDGVNANSLNPVHSLLCFGGDNGLIECWDPRTKNRVAVHDVQHSISIFNRSIEQTNCGINSLQFDKDGVTLGVGTTEGHCLLYDIRSSTPLIIKEHQYGDPIKKIMFQDKKVISIDNKIVKIWDRSESNGKVIANIEPTNDINDVILCPNSGLFLMATEQPKIMSYFIPELGPAPKWCAFLDNLTEELEENKQSIYDDYKFVTKEEIERLSLTKLIGTNYLRAYMHGYFMDLKLYNKLRAIADPFEFEDYRKAKIKEKIEKEQTARIGIKRNIPTVNVKTALRIMQNDKTGKSIMNDNRFADMFENPDFQIDENDDKYKMYHSSNSQPNGKNIMDHFDKIDSDEEEEAEEDQENDIDDQNGSIDFDDKEDEEEEEKLTKQTISKVPQTKQGQTNKQSKKIEFYELKSGHEAALRKGENITKNQQLTLGERLQQQRETSKPAAVKRNAFGALEMTFMPENKKRKDTSHKDEWVARLGERRSARDILPKVKLRSGPRSKKSKM